MQLSKILPCKVNWSQCASSIYVLLLLNSYVNATAHWNSLTLWVPFSQASCYLLLCPTLFQPCRTLTWICTLLWHCHDAQTWNVWRNSGKWWNLDLADLTDWLLSKGFIQSSLNNTYLIKVYADRSFICSSFTLTTCPTMATPIKLRNFLKPWSKAVFKSTKFGTPHCTFTTLLTDMSHLTNINMF
jgi:hypothetical protein